MTERDYKALELVNTNEFALVEEAVVDKLIREGLIEEFYVGEDSDVRITAKGERMLRMLKGAARTCHW